jgi:hypothetical protein
LFTTFLCNPKWMKDNIEPDIAGMSGEAIADAAAPQDKVEAPALGALRPL